MPLPRAPGCPLSPPAAFAEWRESDGLQLASWRGRPTWVVSRYEDIRAAPVDPRLSADTIPDTMKATSTENKSPQIFPRIDDPEHNRLRRMMTRDFTFRRTETMRPQIQELVDGFLDDMIAGGPPADLVRDFALPLPSLVISLLLGVPYEDHEFFQEKSTLGLDSRSTDEEKAVSIGEIFGYMFELVARKEREPGDDMITRLLTDYVATGALSRETATMSALIMLQAGHKTTASMIALGTLALLQHPEQLTRLRETDDPAVVANLVEELMRYLTIVHSLVERVAREDLTIAGQLVRSGDIVLMNRPAGNWDAAFVDAPGRLDADRNSRGHLGFGYGVHQCIGQNLARAELQIALSSLARRLPGLRLAVPESELRFQNEKEIYGIDALPVTW
ncbi:cytochrome P450 [Mycolicibacterium pyrenivorans]|uniref:cytochrome P450 n=1 Tax=Mycolicibacterium pyrenivorans TaxID=187102 RepID=UPI0021F26A01|nr:cytochrome P450 [Mycolicibacterium pyrenivorans]MCV7154956.1 cytochrome P450 [Mycolicibacterium pyrenivorans]